MAPRFYDLAASFPTETQVTTMGRQQRKKVILFDDIYTWYFSIKTQGATVGKQDGGDNEKNNSLQQHLSKYFLTKPYSFGQQAKGYKYA